jgi:uncharacterized protein DUF2252
MRDVIGHQARTRGAQKSRGASPMQLPFVAANTAFEKWLRKQCKVDGRALERKHGLMRKDAFLFLRATYFRWAGAIEALLPDLPPAPAVLAVGDAHVQNFGIWHDLEGRLVWGINDFDDAAVIPYTFDLVRLATSATLSGQTSLSRRQICSDIMEGYLAGLRRPEPFVLNEKYTWLRRRVRATKKTIERFWRDIDELKKGDPPAKVKHALRELLPRDCEDIRYTKRIAGGGGLGRPRFVVIARWRGGRIVREAKALVPSAWDWSHNGAPGIRFLKLANSKSRSPDPNLRLRSGYLLRRLSPESRKLELGDADNVKVDRQLLQAMGREIGAIHGVDREDAKRISGHLNKMDAGWLARSTKAAEVFVRADFAEWKRATGRRKR